MRESKRIPKIECDCYSVLNFLRIGSCPRLPAAAADLQQLLEDAEFYQVPLKRVLHEATLTMLPESRTS